MCELESEMFSIPRNLHISLTWLEESHAGIVAFREHSLRDLIAFDELL
jgi:hypothetical protein